MTSIATPEREEETRARMLADVRDGLSRAQKELSPKYFYDTRGSELFEQITRLPEYYLTRTERRILTDWMPALTRRLRAATLAELGAGNGEKARIILDAMHAAGSARAYVPIDVSAGFLESAAEDLQESYPRLRLRPIAADMTVSLHLPSDLSHPILFALLGSTIGNFDDRMAVRLLRRIRNAMSADDHLLLGADLRKDPAVIEAAYNDAAGVTAEFNRNILHVLNRELGADFDPESFEHRAIYVERSHRIEMHLVARSPQVATVPGAGVFVIDETEYILTEISCKYDRAAITDMCGASGLRVVEWCTDARGLFGLALLAVDS